MQQHWELEQTTGLHGRDLYHRCLHFAARCLIAAARCVWLHLVSWSSVIRSHPGSAPARLPLPECVQTGAQAQFIQGRPRRQMFTIVPLLGLKASRVREGARSGGAAQLIKETTCERAIRPFCLMLISCWAVFDGNLCSDYSGVQWARFVCCIKYEVDYKWKRN